ncbi:MAG: hypothetical protein EBY24_13020 [Betaproteobacteria bacterium]|jgi:hypothetical protein|nr:hypothetical protein [Betaproteobacteria bacterium]
MPQAPIFTRPLALLALSLCLAAAGPVRAQTAPTVGTGDSARIELLVERIHVEDASSRIDELRVGGETRKITVSPKGGMPAYDIVPFSASRSAATADGGGASLGNRVWKILSF